MMMEKLLAIWPLSIATTERFSMPRVMAVNFTEGPTVLFRAPREVLFNDQE